MNAVLLCYTLGKVDHKTRSKFKRELLGYTDKSNKGKYKYMREGLLSNIPHCRPIRSVIVVEKKHEGVMVDFLKKYNAEIKKFIVAVDKKQLIPTSGSDA